MIPMSGEQEQLPAVTNIACELLIEALRAQGGEPLDDPCMGEKVTFRRPDGIVAGNAFSCFCGGLTRFAAPYDPGTKKKTQAVTACIECDAALGWPRFQKETA